MASLGVEVRKLRKAARLTQRQLASQTGVDPTYLSKIENDRLEHTPSVRAIQALAAALDADEIELMELANKLPPALEVFAREPEARRFLRRAGDTLRTADDWRAVTEFLDRRQAGTNARSRGAG